MKLFTPKYPHYPQNEVMDCGPACLRMVAKFYGHHHTLQNLRKKCFITREGVSLLGISDAAESIGFRTNGVKLTIEQLVEEAKLPCILHWNQSHFVVRYNIYKRHGKTHFCIGDPASQVVTYSESEFTKCWLGGVGYNPTRQGIALLLEPSAYFYTIEEDTVVKGKRSLFFFISYLLPYKSLFLQLAVGMALGSFLQLAFPLLTQSLVDYGIGNRDLGFITLILISQLFLFLSQLAVESIRSWILLHINTRIDIALISDFLAKLMSLPLCYFDTKMTGDIMQRIGDHGRIKSLLMSNGFSMIFSFFNFFLFAGILGYYHPKILAIFLVGNGLYVVWVLAFMRFRRELDIKRFNLSAGEQSTLIQLIQGIQEIKLNNCESQKRWEWERLQAKQFKLNIRGLKLSQVQQTGSIFFTQSTNIIISFIAAGAVVAGDMTLGMMMSMTYILGQVAAPINDFIGFSQSVQDAQISLERLNEIHLQKDEEQLGEHQVRELPIARDITFTNVRFSYSGAKRDYALDNVTLTIPQGQVTAIVGASGSGKTTLVKMIQGFYQPLEGQIKVGNTPLTMIHPRFWRKNVGAVMQENFIFSDTIANNIAIGVDEIDPVRLHNAVRMANIEEFILSLPLGYATKIGMEGCGISAGQRQRLLIARAIYKNPQFIILDEATNSLDTSNERIIMKNLNSFYKGRTVVIVAHRLSTVRQADKIIVLDHGRVAEEGTHDTLIAQRGLYYKLVHNQIELNRSDLKTDF